jgi:hypothetical protein
MVHAVRARRCADASHGPGSATARYAKGELPEADVGPDTRLRMPYGFSAHSTLEVASSVSLNNLILEFDIAIWT